MNQPPARKGATRASDIPAHVLQALSCGEIHSATLAECLALDQARLLRVVFPQASARLLNAVDQACLLGILRRMSAIGSALLDELGATGIAVCAAHPADTVRGWACFMIGAQPELDLAARLQAIAPLADDPHFGVREWAWMALRPHLVRELERSVQLLQPWTFSESERLRRFACEVLRPRGVWCAHIAELKRRPQHALSLLQALHADESVYVQDSLANWLNDAGKDQPDWVRGLCGQWLQGEPSPATRRICQRAMRNLQ